MSSSLLTRRSQVHKNAYRLETRGSPTGKRCLELSGFANGRWHGHSCRHGNVTCSSEHYVPVKRAVGRYSVLLTQLTERRDRCENIDYVRGKARRPESWALFGESSGEQGKMSFAISRFSHGLISGAVRSGAIGTSSREESNWSDNCPINLEINLDRPIPFSVPQGRHKPPRDPVVAYRLFLPGFVVQICFQKVSAVHLYSAT